MSCSKMNLPAWPMVRHKQRRAVALCLLLALARPVAATWYFPAFEKGADTILLDLQYPSWTVSWYHAIWNAGFYPEGGKFYGGVASYPASPDKAYQAGYIPGIVWTFWSHPDYQGRSVTPLYNAPFLYGKGRGGEGAQGGLGGNFEGLRCAEWFTMLMKAWPAQQAEDGGYVGWWVKDIVNDVWTLLGVLQVPCKVTGFSNNSCFVETLGKSGQLREFLQRNSYYRKEGKWVAVDSLWYNKSDEHSRFEATGGDTFHFVYPRIEGKQTDIPAKNKETVTLSGMRKEPVLDKPAVTEVGLDTFGAQALVAWRVPSNAAPQLGYTIELFDNAACLGEPLQTRSDVLPHIRMQRLDLAAGATPVAVRLTVHDVFGQDAAATQRAAPVAVAPAALQPRGDLRPGLAFACYLPDKDEPAWMRIPDLSGRQPVRQGYARALDTSPKPRSSLYAMTFDGFLSAPASGIYVMEVRTSDGGRLWLDGRKVFDYDGIHMNSPRRFDVPLTAGLHAFRFAYFQGEKAFADPLEIAWEGPGFALREVDHDLVCVADQSVPAITLRQGRDVGPAKSLHLDLDPDRRDIEKVEYYRDGKMVRALFHPHAYEFPNLAQNAVVTLSHPQSGGALGRIVDGCLSPGSSSFDMPNAAGKWIQLDLDRPRVVSSIFTLWHEDAKRYYRYELAVSLDGEHWQTVARKSDTEPETPGGHWHAFPATQARYVRLLNMSNSANASVHVKEVMVFAEPMYSKDKPYACTTLLPEGANRMRARLWYGAGKSVDSNVVTVDARNATSGTWTVSTLGEAGGNLAYRVGENGGQGMGEGCFFAYKKLTGDFSLSGRIGDVCRRNSETSVLRNDWTGLFVKRDLSSLFSWHFGIYQTAGHGLQMSTDQADLAGQHTAYWTNNEPGMKWLRIVRNGQKLISSYSIDGKAWIKAQERMERKIPETLYAGMVYKSTPGKGETYFWGGMEELAITTNEVSPPLVRPPAAADLDLDQRLTAIIQPVADPGVLYLRTTHRGLLKSVDGGEHWSPIGASCGAAVRTLAVHPKDPGILLCGTGSGVWRSQDAGGTWTRIATGMDFAGRGVTSLFGETIAFDPLQPARVAAGTESAGLFISEDTGKTWQHIGLQGAWIACIGFNPYDAVGRRLYVGTLGGDALAGLNPGASTVPGKRAAGGLYYVYPEQKNRLHPAFEDTAWGVTDIAFDLRHCDTVHYATTRGQYYTCFTKGSMLFQRYQPPIDTLYASVSSMPQPRGCSVVTTAPFSAVPGREGLHVTRLESIQWSSVACEDQSVFDGVSCVWRDLANDATIYVCSRRGLYKSLDGGATYRCLLDSRSP